MLKNKIRLKKVIATILPVFIVFSLMYGLNFKPEKVYASTPLIGGHQDNEAAGAADIRGYPADVKILNTEISAPLGVFKFTSPVNGPCNIRLSSGGETFYWYMFNPSYTDILNADSCGSDVTNLNYTFAAQKNTTYYIQLYGASQDFVAPIYISVLQPKDADPVTITDVSDIANNGDGRDLQVKFNKAADESKIGSYRIMVVKASKAGSFNLTAANSVASGRYTEVGKVSGNIVKVLASEAKDTDGDDIVTGTAYKVFVLSVADGTNATTSALSSASEAITLDSLSPSFTVSGNATEWTKDDVTLTISATDDIGLNASAYSFNNGDTWIASSSKSFSENGNYILKVRDKSGNTTQKTIVINRIDKAAPSFLSITKSPSDWTDGSVTLTVNGCTDNGGVGLNDATYSFSTTAGQYNWQTSNVSPSFSQNQNVYVYVRDSLGNFTGAAVNISNIDKTAPNTPVITDADKYTSGKWYNSAQTVAATFTPTAGSNEKLQYSLNNGAWTDGGSFNVTSPGVNTLKFKVIDELNRSSGEVSCIVQIDTTSPTVTLSDTNTNWRKDDFTVSMSFSDDEGSGVNTKEYAVTNSDRTPTVWTAASNPQTINISDEGYVYLHYKATDLAGNSTISFIEYKMDKTAPTGSIFIQQNKVWNGYEFVRSQSPTLNLSGIDPLGGSGLWQMRIANSEADLNNAEWKSFSNTKNDYSLSNGNGIKIVYYRLRDFAYNVSQVYSDSIYLDDTKPTLTISEASKNIAKASDTVTFTVDISDNSRDFGVPDIASNNGIDNINLTSGHIQLTTTGSVNVGGIGKTVEPVQGEPTKRLITLTIPSNIAGSGTVNVRIDASAAEDKAGNLSDAITFNNVFQIDASAPVINSVTGNPNDWTKDSVTLTVNASDAIAGLADKPYSFDNGANWQAENTKTYNDNTSNIIVKVKDKFENIAIHEIINITKIDKTTPNAALISNKNIYGENKWFNSPQTIEATFTSTPGADEVLQYKVDDGPWISSAFGSVVINDEGKHTVSFNVRDSFGRTGQVDTVKVNIDRTAPTNAKITIKDNVFTSLLNTITFGTFFKDTVDVAITADSNISGESKIEYQKVISEAEYDGNGTWTEGASFSVASEEQFIVYARITDKAGNYVIINSNGVIVDVTEPQLILTPETYGWSKSNINVNVDASDSFSGLKEVSYTTDEAVPQSGTVSLVNGQGTITLSNEGQYYLTVTAKDNALNEYSDAIYIRIDKTAPVINNVTGNPTNWTEDNVTLTVTASDGVSGLNNTFYGPTLMAFRSDKPYSFDGGATWQESNTKTYEENASNIVVKVKDIAGNIQTYDTINITKIDKTVPNAAVIANKDKYGENKWLNRTERVTASFTPTEGCAEKLQYKIDNGAWTDGASTVINSEGRYTVRFRVIDELNRTSEEQTVKVNVDKSAPKDAKITIKDNNFTSFLNTITFGLFFKETVDVTITGDSSISGQSKVEYQKVLSTEDYKADGTWVEGSSFTVNPDEKIIVYARVTDNAENYVIISSDGVVVDATNPALILTPDVSEWSSKNVNVKVEASDNLAGVKEVAYTTDETTPQAGTVTLTNGEGTITLINEGQYTLTVKARDNSLNEVVRSVNVKIDKTAPVIASVTGNPTNWTKDNVTLTVTASDGVSGIAAKSYSFDGGVTWQEQSTKTYEENESNIVVKVKDIAGNEKAYEPINITKIDKTAPNAAVINNKDKYGENKWFNEAETVTARFTPTAGSNEKLQYKVGNGAWIDGTTIAINVSGESSVSFRVMDELGRTGNLDSINIKLDENAPTITSVVGTSNSLEEGKITLTIAASDALSGLSDKAYSFDGGRTWQETNAKTFEENAQGIEVRVKDIAGNVAVYQTINLKVENTESEVAVTATGIDGTTFSSDMYLVVTEIKENDNKTEFNAALEKVKNSISTVPEIKDKELVALYDISLFKDKVKIQPDGKLKIKIKIPENLKDRKDLEIIYIADDGKITVMNAKMDDEYLTFITDHLSSYAIVSKPIDKETIKTESQFKYIPTILSIVFFIFIIVFIKKRKKDEEEK